MAALGTVAIAVCFLFPIPAPPDQSMAQAAGAAGHVFLFAALAFLWGRALPRWASGWFLWGFLALAAALLEWVQPWAGRSCEGSDWLFGVGGAACICGTASSGWKAAARWGCVGVLAVLPLVWTAGLRASESRAFPALASPDAFWSRRGWIQNGVRISPESAEAFRVESRLDKQGDAAPYPGLFRRTVNPNWKGGGSFQTRLYWPGPSKAVFAIRVDDLSDNPPYAERFQREFSVTQGWNRIDIPAAEWGRTSEGRPMKMEAIHLWGVFLVAGPPLDYFLLGAVHLESQQEEP
jgi:hypothetical protein